MNAHDDWNLLSLGALNVAHVGWWTGLFASERVLECLFYCDAAYLLMDTCWLVFVPSCVPARSRNNLLVHHAIVCLCLPYAMGKPVLMRHLLRVWMVELHSWNHIAVRRFANASPMIAAIAERVNKPLFFALRLVGFPLSWFVYARERAALSAAVIQAHAPFTLHVPLSLAHFAMYGIMLKWGQGLLLSS
jgi:hypothetical protein